VTGHERHPSPTDVGDGRTESHPTNTQITPGAGAVRLFPAHAKTPTAHAELTSQERVDREVWRLSAISTFVANACQGIIPTEKDLADFHAAQAVLVNVGVVLRERARQKLQKQISPRKNIPSQARIDAAAREIRATNRFGRVPLNDLARETHMDPRKLADLETEGLLSLPK
jgi:hypothetical protein